MVDNEVLPTLLNLRKYNGQAGEILAGVQGHAQRHKTRYACSPAGQLRASGPVGTGCPGSDLLNNAEKLKQQLQAF
ncbi:hypothetical protein GCM10022394_19830 [Zobellella aerophila]|uniref:Uncharacterized protein n=1 Tax=Zobellella aerophila TaxID=870480 RepID=A0ABP6VWU1_9GAMM